MKTRRLNVISALTIFVFTQCGSPPDLTEDEIYNTLNEIIAQDSLNIDRACWKFDSFDLTEEMKKEFSPEDFAFIAKQKKRFIKMKLKPNKLKWFYRGAKTFYSTIIDSNCNNSLIYHISYPIISADRKKVIIEIKWDCNCMLGGSGGKDMYEKKNGHWVWTKGFDHWISENSKNNDQNTRL